MTVTSVLMYVPQSPGICAPESFLSEKSNLCKLYGGYNSDKNNFSLPLFKCSY